MLSPIEAAIADFNRSTTNHTPSLSTIEEIEEYRNLVQKLAEIVITAIPPSRARSITLTHLEDAVMWGVKAMILRDKDQNG